LVDSSQDMISRRLLLGLMAGLPLAACATRPAPNPTVTAEDDLSGWYVGSLPDEPYSIPLVDRSRMRPELNRQVVPYRGGERPGTIVVDIDDRFLYLVQGDGTATRYGVGVGKQGFSWKGAATVGRKAAWPDWGPTATMVSLKPDLPRFQKGGLDNPPRRPCALPISERPRHPVPHSRHERALDYRRSSLERLHPHAERGHRGPLRPRAGRDHRAGPA
jgi:lipoprotein-anchoring transpeptidase ErfK/SrfK